MQVCSVVTENGAVDRFLMLRSEGVTTTDLTAITDSLPPSTICHGQVVRAGLSKRNSRIFGAIGAINGEGRGPAGGRAGDRPIVDEIGFASIVVSQDRERGGLAGNGGIAVDDDLLCHGWRGIGRFHAPDNRGRSWLEFAIFPKTRNYSRSAVRAVRAVRREGRDCGPLMICGKKYPDDEDDGYSWSRSLIMPRSKLRIKTQEQRTVIARGRMSRGHALSRRRVPDKFCHPRTPVDRSAVGQG